MAGPQRPAYLRRTGQDRRSMRESVGLRRHQDYGWGTNHARPSAAPLRIARAAWR